MELIMEIKLVNIGFRAVGSIGACLTIDMIPTN